MKNYSSYLLLIWCTLVLCSCSQVPTNLYPIYKNGKYGYIDSLGNEVIKPQYLYASYFNLANDESNPTHNSYIAITKTGYGYPFTCNINQINQMLSFIIDDINQRINEKL